MDKGRLHVLFGRSAVGKTTIQKLLGKYMLQGISCTTRPKRENEIDGIDYYFLTDEEFDKREKNGEFMEVVPYNNWKYATPYSSIDLTKGDYVLVTETEGFKQIREKLGKENVVGIYLYLSDPWELLKRSIDRQPHATEAQCNEICRRFLSDKETFKEAEKLAVLKINNINTSDTVDIILRNIKNKSI